MLEQGSCGSLKRSQSGCRGLCTPDRGADAPDHSRVALGGLYTPFQPKPRSDITAGAGEGPAQQRCSRLAPCGCHFTSAPGLKAGDGGPLVRVGPARPGPARFGLSPGSQPRPGPAEGGGPARPRLLGAARPWRGWRRCTPRPGPPCPGRRMRCSAASTGSWSGTATAASAPGSRYGQGRAARPRPAAVQAPLGPAEPRSFLAPLAADARPCPAAAVGEGAGGCVGTGGVWGWGVRLWGVAGGCPGGGGVQRGVGVLVVGTPLAKLGVRCSVGVGGRGCRGLLLGQGWGVSVGCQGGG